MEKSNSGNGLGICTVLFIVFLVLKLCNVIAWSWWWVTAPMWGGIVLFILLVIVLLIVGKIIRKKLLY